MAFFSGIYHQLVSPGTPIFSPPSSGMVTGNKQKVKINLILKLRENQ